MKESIASTRLYQYVEEKPSEIYHHITEVNGTCEKEGSLMTHIFLSEMKKMKENMSFYDIATILDEKINNVEKWNEDEYYSFWKTYGLTRGVTRLTIPFLF